MDFLKEVVREVLFLNFFITRHNRAQLIDAGEMDCY